ncbi:MAG: SDR family NAD(P)-dependent oxidoreductase [Deltaproteobacteria bacterium]|nr:SDR family NAD(P)-dependent oxidoreductase [Deltaproteobacteria bacterium]
MIVLITGASGGLGPVVGRTLVERGLTVYGTARTVEGRELPDSFPFLPMEITNEASIQACIDDLLEREGRIDAVVNCANEMFIGATLEASAEEVRALYDVNVFGPLRVARQVLPAMLTRGRGTIVNMSSLGGILAVPYMGAYTSSKFALEALTEALYHEVKPRGIDVVIMQPVAMRMDRPATGSHLRVVEGAASDSFSHNMAAQMAADTEASKLTPEAVAEKIHEVITSKNKPLRVPMDRAKVLTVVKRLAPQSIVNRLLGSLMKSAESIGPGTFSTTGAK